MNIKHKQLSLLGLLLATSLGANAQGIMGGHVTGNIQLVSGLVIGCQIQEIIICADFTEDAVL